MYNTTHLTFRKMSELENEKNILFFLGKEDMIFELEKCPEFTPQTWKAFNLIEDAEQNAKSVARLIHRFFLYFNRMLRFVSPWDRRLLPEEWQKPLIIPKNHDDCMLFAGRMMKSIQEWGRQTWACHIEWAAEEFLSCHKRGLANQEWYTQCLYNLTYTLFVAEYFDQCRLVKDASVLMFLWCDKVTNPPRKPCEKWFSDPHFDVYLLDLVFQFV